MAVAVGLIVWFAAVGLSTASQLSTVAAAVIVVLALAVAAYTAVLVRQASPAKGGDAHNNILGGTFHGSVWQGRDYNGRRPDTSTRPDQTARREGDGGAPPG